MLPAFVHSIWELFPQTSVLSSLSPAILLSVIAGGLRALEHCDQLLVEKLSTLKVRDPDLLLLVSQRNAIL